MRTRENRILKNCQTNHHEKCIKPNNNCRCECNKPSEINSIDVKLLTLVGIIPKTFCPDCKINYEKEYDVCIKCYRNLIRKYLPQKKHWKDSMGKIEFLMHKRAQEEYKERKLKNEEINHIYQLGRLRARYCFGKRSLRFWDKKANEKQVHNFAVDEVHQHLGHAWSPWERKWIE